MHRFADMISAARHLGLPKLKHDVNYYHGTLNDVDAEAFIKTEEGIRLVAENPVCASLISNILILD